MKMLGRMVLSCYLGLWMAAFLSASAEQLIPIVKRDNPAVISAKLQAAPPGIRSLQARDVIPGLAMKNPVCRQIPRHTFTSNRAGWLLA